MTPVKTRKIGAAFTLLMIAALACSLPGVGANNAQPSAIQEEATLPAGQPTQAPVDSPVPTQPDETPTPTPTLVHTTIPSSPGGANSFRTDPSAQDTGDATSNSSDIFSNLLFERPYTSDVMSYLGYLDVTRSDIHIGSPFFYVTITLKEAPPADSNAYYGVEFDTDKDGRGDWLIYGQAPNGTDWTVEGVRVYQDSNNDVGGNIPVQPDGVGSFDGYDQMLFDQGYNTSDPDMAWIRRDPSNPNRIQIAFKYSVIGSASKFLWSVWSDEGPVQPAWFDYNDHFTLDEAGSPEKSNSYYPIKQLAMVDNHCRQWYGFTPTGLEPGICPIPPTPTPVVPGSISGRIFSDINFDGSFNGSDTGLSSFNVRLRNNNCGGSVVATASPNGAGYYSFSNVQPGKYCVEVVITLATGCAGWKTVTGKTTIVNVGNGAAVNASWMGFANIIC